jgi:hypothetical protein
MVKVEHSHLQTYRKTRTRPFYFVCPGDAVISCIMAEYCEFEWHHQHIGISDLSPTKTETLNGIQDKSLAIQAVRNLIPTRPEIGEFST